VVLKDLLDLAVQPVLKDQSDLPVVPVQRVLKDQWVQLEKMD
jgi:hypothetical protein